jgi:ubiquinone/menaquinone biosynthesis C-methylase UbiE
MLDRMNREVIDALRLTPGGSRRLLDLGCGLGATARWAVAYDRALHVYGLTIVPWQAQEAERLTPRVAAAAVRYLQADYSAIPFLDASFDGVYALESSCYAAGYTKRPLLEEAFRVLTPGGRLVIADAFLKVLRPMNPLNRWCYDELCKSWSLETLGEIHQVHATLQAIGFEDIHITNISKNVTPSVLHIPFVATRFLVRHAVDGGGPLRGRRWDHLRAGLLLMAFTLDRTRSGYFLISARKPARAPGGPGLHD